MKGKTVFLIILLTFFLFLSCSTAEETNEEEIHLPTDSKNIMPSDFEYLGAFLTPEPNPVNDSLMWEWGAQAMAFNPLGNPNASRDFFQGSLFGTGHDVWNLVSEISIPQPIISPSKSLEDLNTSKSLQPFANLREGLFEWIDEMPRVGMEILPAMGDQATSKLYLCWGQHIQDAHPSHMWCELDLQNPNPQGEWFVNGLNPYNSNDYLFKIPVQWANQYTPGLRLATGRFRDGGWSGFGPTLAAIGPYNHGNPPINGQVLNSTMLIKYADFYQGEPAQWDQMNGYSHADEWSGGAWLITGDKSAVVFVGTKGIGETWYGDPNGPCMECSLPHLRGWWSERFEGWFLFYSTSDLAKVASGQMQPYEIQPYAHLNVDDVLYYIDCEQEKYHLGACAFDSENGLFYVFESGRDTSSGKQDESRTGRFDLERTLVHVWKIQ